MSLIISNGDVLLPDDVITTSVVSDSELMFISGQYTLEAELASGALKHIQDLQWDGNWLATWVDDAICYFAVLDSDLVLGLMHFTATWENEVYAFNQPDHYLIITKELAIQLQEALVITQISAGGKLTDPSVVSRLEQQAGMLEK